MNKKELLEKAAKAAGIEGEYVSWCYNGFKEGIRKPNDKSSAPWNPITDNCSAFDLIVKLKMSVTCGAVYSQTNNCFPVKNFDDPHLALRLSIVKCAANSLD